MISPYVDNIWRHWWAGHMAAVGGTSLLPLEPIEPPLSAFFGLAPEAELLPVHRPTRAGKLRPVKPKKDETKTWQSPELAGWAKNLLGDERNNQHTVEDLLEAIDDYFELFAKLKKYGDPYNYFSRVGTPVMLRNTMIYTRDIDRLKIPNAEKLPSMFGAFITRTKTEHREDILKEEPNLLDFEFFEKLRNNYATAAPLGTTIFRHNLISLGRGEFSRAELRKFPHARGIWGVSWLVGVLPDGSVKALPVQMTRTQHLPSGYNVYHSGMMVPPGLKELCKHGADYYVRILFNTLVAMTASALTGVQVTVKRGNNAFRFGLPITNLKTFFGDRDLEGNAIRRRAILHLRKPHLRTLASGKEIVVGEHLSGDRFFTWRDCNITVSAPGIHHPAIESFDPPMITDEDRDYAELDKSEMIDTKRIGDELSSYIWQRRKSKFQRGRPVTRYRDNPLEKQKSELE